MRHPKFIARTIFVQDGNVQQALRSLNTIMSREGLFDQYRRTRRYEKPFEMRRRVNYERCRAVYNEEMTRKLNLLMKVNRVDPFPGCS